MASIAHNNCPTCINLLRMIGAKYCYHKNPFIKLLVYELELVLFPKRKRPFQ